MYLWFFFFNDTATTEIYTLSLHDALPILRRLGAEVEVPLPPDRPKDVREAHEALRLRTADAAVVLRSEEHTSELQSRQYLVCRLLLEKKKTNIIDTTLHLSIDRISKSLK